jgi:arylsulfatase A-like enzyme
MERLLGASTHGSPWRYDTLVPIVIAGKELEPLTVDRPVQTVDVAVTLAAFLGIKSPSGSTGLPLVEVLAR